MANPKTAPPMTEEHGEVLTLIRARAIRENLKLRITNNKDKKFDDSKEFTDAKAAGLTKVAEDYYKNSAS